MIKELYTRNKFLCKLFVVLTSALLIWLAIDLISAYQSYNNDKNTIVVTVNPYVENSDVTAFDVTGLTNEEIAEYLENYREQQGGE